MGKQARIKQERRIQKAKDAETMRIRNAEILVELSNRGDEYDRLFVEKFGRLDREGDFEEAEDKVRFIADRMNFWNDIKSRYNGKTREELSDADINDIMVMDKMRVDYYKMAEKVGISLEDLTNASKT